jgi:DNA-binding NarL/FixJ family response regulator
MNNTSTSTKLKLLIVEDSLIISEHIFQLMQKFENIEVVGVAASAVSAMKLADATNPDLAILDIHLQDSGYDKNGITLLTDMKKKLPKLKVVMFTNNIEPFYQTKSKEAGAEFHFDKSFDIDKVEEWVMKCIEAHNSTLNTK